MPTHQTTAQNKAGQPLISFIVTCYNLPTTLLKECLDSILALSLSREEREIILVDDGSDENPMNDLMPYGSNIIYLRKANGGVSTARNMGLAMATGKYIQFVDGDDIILRSPYEHCIDIARFSTVDMVMFDFTANPQKPLTSFDEDAPKSGTELMRTENIHGSACLYLFRQAIRGNLLFTPDISYGEDEEFTARLILRAEKVQKTKSTAYYYRPNTTSVTHQSDTQSIVKRLQDAHLVICRLNSMLDHLPYNDRLAMQRRIAQLTMDYLYNTIRLTRSRRYLDKKIEELRKIGLFPLPDRNYTKKYTWFRRLTNSQAGLSLLMRIIPLTSKER